ncbi:hypothetical protein KL921_000449 [Ogataea angusta]|nr:hypothetical protein KL921_000449 [Ogataea angusta]KAG7831214.1 hypothetical protein KL920_000734 [Ogataea angusta]KAG7837158.1 hypothetical protein KL943_001197 [Ogataea angusta]KAG7853289.1 hypothetical protein KL941_000339 [Ogataea angusta]KAG7864418.1 hypothetical protein KL919_000446 [Ogataea angusta]
MEEREQKEDALFVGCEPSRLRKALLKVSFTWATFVSRLRSISEACLESDEITEQLFDDDSDSNSTRIQEYEPIKPSEVQRDLLEKKLANDDKETCSTGSPLTTTRLTSPQSSAVSGGDESSAAPDKEGTLTPFCGGEELWKIQNQQWLKPIAEYTTLEGKLKLQKRLRSQDLRHYVSSKDYHIIYRNLVIDGRSLKQPMNLRDLLRVVEAGWEWSRVQEGGYFRQR